MADAVLTIKDLTKRYGDVEVLQKLNLVVTRGAIHGLVGLNGSGKTTTMECLLGMQGFSSGDISVMGRHPRDLWQGQGDVVGIFDTPGLHPGLTVRQCLEHARLLCGNPVRTPEQVENLLGIGKYSGYKIRQLSLGNRRRASIAHALIGQPAFVVLDEPFNGLDAGGVDDVLALIQKLNREEGTSFLLSSHQLAYLENICTHLSILHQGKIALSASTYELISPTESRLRVVCNHPEAAYQILKQTVGVIKMERSGPAFLLKLDGVGPADINHKLVMAGLMVSELQPERRDLAALFQDIVNSTHKVKKQEAA
ncbi:MAG: ABC transporter ATP-binding protein [Pseudohongiella sp.]|nr:ABC transporter ATP-binding protein [Pseudohongiella sp.]MDO9519227.1 ABC transporter ATP-binding protein [Pseudohongiella sp.]MDP2128338.1 ABC transporter ATP-binding protein [Pseudohongiella sp.]